MAEKEHRRVVDVINEYCGTNYETLDDIPREDAIKMLIACIIAAEATFADRIAL
jgi:hypothetical protein